MRSTSPVLVMALVLAAPAFADNTCTFALTPAAERDSLYRMLSANAQAVAAPNAATTSKRRSVGKPSTPPTTHRRHVRLSVGQARSTRLDARENAGLSSAEFRASEAVT